MNVNFEPRFILKATWENMRPIYRSSGTEVIILGSNGSFAIVFHKNEI